MPTMQIDPKTVKELRDRTNAGMMDCKRALTEANALGLNDRFRPFALNYIHTHPR